MLEDKVTKVVKVVRVTKVGWWMGEGVYDFDAFWFFIGSNFAVYKFTNQ